MGTTNPRRGPSHSPRLCPLCYILGRLREPLALRRDREGTVRASPSSTSLTKKPSASLRQKSTPVDGAYCGKNCIYRRGGRKRGGRRKLISAQQQQEKSSQRCSKLRGTPIQTPKAFFNFLAVERKRGERKAYCAGEGSRRRLYTARGTDLFFPFARMSSSRKKNRRGGEKGGGLFSKKSTLLDFFPMTGRDVPHLSWTAISSFQKREEGENLPR